MHSVSWEGEIVGNRGFVVQFPARVKDSSLLLEMYKPAVGPSRAPTECVAGTFPGDVAARCVKLDHSYPCSAETQNVCNCPCILWRIFMTGCYKAVTWKTREEVTCYYSVS